MYKVLATMTAVLALSACGDPLARVEKLSDVELPEDVAPTQEALVAAPEEFERPEGGLLSGLFRRAQPQPDPVDAAIAAATQALPAETTTTTTIVTTQAPSAEVVAEPIPLDTQEVAEPVAVEDTAVAAVEDAPVAAPEPAQRPGIFGRIFARGDAEPAPAPAPAAEQDAVPVVAEAEAPQTEQDDSTTEVASLSPTLPTAPEPKAKPETKREGLLGGLLGPRAVKPRTGPDASDVAIGTTLAFGTIARVCDAKGTNLGKKTESFGRGKQAFTLYDSVPGSTAPRTFYVTGFADGCPRQFTAALALFGEPALHEQLRYGRPSDKYPYSTTDQAYEKVKSAICRVAKRQPCGAQISALEKNTVFISTYERFSDNGRWADILLHDGLVLAASLKDL